MRSFVFLIVGLSTSIPGSTTCNDWYQSTLECGEHRKKLKKDPTNTVCDQLIGSLKSGEKSHDKLIKISRCLQWVAPPEKIPEYEKKLREKLPDKEHWHFNALKNYRTHREISSALDMAHLAEIKFSGSALVRSELTEVYIMASRFISAGDSYIKELELNPSRIHTFKYKFKSLIQSASLDFAPGDFLDSLINRFPEPTEIILDLLLDLSWDHKHYRGTLACLLGKIKIAPLPWGQMEKWLIRFEQTGLLDYAEILLRTVSWQKAKPEIKNPARKRFIKIQHLLSSTKTLCEDFDGFLQGQEKDYESMYYLATAAARCQLADSEKQIIVRRQAEQLAQRLIENAPSPWNYRGVFVFAETRISRGDITEARKILRKEKSNSARTEGTGPLLHWLAVTELLDGRYFQADSLLVLASAYTGGETTNRSLELRHFLLLDSASGARKLFFSGIPEAPMSPRKKMASLGKISPKSPLWPMAQIEISNIWKNLERPDSARSVLKNLAKNSSDPWVQNHARATANFLDEKSQKIAKALAIYDEILLKYQQGIISEFSRERVQSLKKTKK